MVGDGNDSIVQIVDVRVWRTVLGRQSIFPLLSVHNIYVPAWQSGTFVFQYVRSVDVRTHARIRTRLEAVSRILYGVRIGAALLQMGVAAAAGEYYIQLLGASGAVMGLLLAFGVMHPNEVLIILPIPIPIKAKWFVIGYAVIELLLGWTGMQASVAHFAHVGGMLWGLALLYYWKRRGTLRF